MGSLKTGPSRGDVGGASNPARIGHVAPPAGACVVLDAEPRSARLENGHDLAFAERAGRLGRRIVTDPTDPKLAHLDGLNLSRAWMLEGMASGLPAGDARVAGLRAAAAVHRDKGLAAVTGEHYEGGHWLGTFAVYLVTGRGLAPVSGP